MDGARSTTTGRSTNSTRRPVVGQLSLLLVLATTLLVAGCLLPVAEAAQSVVAPAHGRLASRVAGAPYGLSPRPTPSPASNPLPSLIASYRSKPLPKLSYVSGQTVRRSDDTERRATTDASCLAAGTTAAQINALFASKGSSAGVLNLCPSTTYHLEETIYFTAAGQGLQTLGGSSVARSARAELRIASANISVAVNAMNCVYCNDLYVADLRFNGSRSAYGSLEDGQALLELGGTSQNHTVQRCKIFDTRGWSSLHFIEGSNLVCSGATVVDNEIGPSGESYNVGKIADGISLSCANSYVAFNSIFDATDGAIVIFSSPGSQIVNNTITASNSLTLGAVNMVDWAPWGGDYIGTRVEHNQITADGDSFKIGIAIGPAVWGDDVDSRNFGGIVSYNRFSGPDLMFGIAVSGVSDFTIEDNTADSSARFGGVTTGNCHGISSKVEPTFALYDRGKTAGIDYGTDANCWNAGVFQYLLCYDPPSSAGAAVAPAFLDGGSGCAAGTPSPVQPARWNNTGLCLEDSQTRILDGAFIQTDDNSVEYCLDRCATLDYTWAGLENGNQCWCGNAVNRGDGYGVVRSPNACRSTCAADTNETGCGGPDYGLALYQDLAQVPVPFDPFAGTSWADSGYCLTDSAARILVGWSDGDGYLTPQFCQSQCSILGFPLAGVENGGECFCGRNILTGPAYSQPKAMSNCDSACLGDGGQMCGGDDYSLHLYYDRSKISQPVYPFTNLTAVASSSSSSSRASSSSSTSAVRSSSTTASASSVSSSPTSSSSSTASASVSGSASCLSPAQSSRRKKASASQSAPTPSSSRLVARATAFL